MSTEFLQSRNTRVTKETLVASVPSFVQDPISWYAMRAILQAVQELRMPTSYMIDIAHDFVLIQEYQPDKFIYCIRKYGTSVFLPSEFDATSLKAHYYVFGEECNFFTYDMEDVRQGDNYNEPQLRKCSYNEAIEFLKP